MKKADKQYLIKAYNAYNKTESWADLDTVYKTCSAEKKRVYRGIRDNLLTCYENADLRVLYGNTYRFTCAAIAKEKNNDTEYFMVWNESSLRCCFYKNGNLIDENGEIFY